MKQYLEMLQHILKNGKRRKNRTGIDTISTFGYQTRYDISKEFPLLTTKKVFYKSIFHELLWFLKGDTNVKYLIDNGVNIWNGNGFDNYKKSKNYKGETEEQWVEKIKTDPSYAAIAGELGPVYGRQWRNFEGVDQIKKLLDQIKNSPTSRRLIVSAWNPKEVDNMALPPCHSLFQFYCDDDGYLSCQLYQRSADAFLGVPFNIASYALLTYIIAAMTGKKPKEFIHTFGDLHIYVNHLEQVKTQLSRKPGKLPKLVIKKIPKKIEDFKIDDFEVVDYNPQGVLKGKMAV